jgi:hypothetical protein
LRALSIGGRGEEEEGASPLYRREKEGKRKKRGQALFRKRIEEEEEKEPIQKSLNILGSLESRNFALCVEHVCDISANLDKALPT